MSVKTISIELDVYERLKALKRDDHESFSQVLRRSLPEKRGISGAELLALIDQDLYPRVGWNDEEIAVIESVDRPIDERIFQ